MILDEIGDDPSTVVSSLDMHAGLAIGFGPREVRSAPFLLLLLWRFPVSVFGAREFCVDEVAGDSRSTASFYDGCESQRFGVVLVVGECFFL